MPTTSATEPPAWVVWIGAAVLIALASEALVTGSGASPRYPVGLIALALAGIARTAAARTQSRRLDLLSAGLVGSAVGLMASGFLA